MNICRVLVVTLIIIGTSSCKKNFETKPNILIFLVDDLGWLNIGSRNFSPTPDISLSDWISLVQSDPNGFSRKVKEYCKSPFANIVVQWATSPTLAVFAQPVRCYQCGFLSKSYQAHSVHCFSKHGVKSALRRYVPLTHCLVSWYVCVNSTPERIA